MQFDSRRFSTLAVVQFAQVHLVHIIISVTENFEILYGCYMHHAMIFFKIMVKYISIIY